MATEFGPADVDARTIYRTLVGTVVPRCIGWISTTSSDGVDNIAPFSFFGVACIDPPMIHFTQGTHADGRLKDTAQNIHETEAFVHNMVTEDTLEAMHRTSETFDSAVSEFDACDIERTPSKTVAPPRVADSPVSIECTLHRALELGTHTLFIGEIQHVNIDDSATTDGKLDIDRISPVGRLTAGRYATLENQLHVESVKDDDFPKTDSSV